jgi:hypothetical protein
MSKMTKSEVYSWRLTPKLKMQLEAAAREENTTVGALLERMTQEWLDKHLSDDAEQQRRLHARARAAIGTVSVGGPPATNENVRAAMGEYLEKKYRASRRRAPRRPD